MDEQTLEGLKNILANCILSCVIGEELASDILLKVYNFVLQSLTTDGVMTEEAIKEMTGINNQFTLSEIHRVATRQATLKDIEWQEKLEQAYEDGFVKGSEKIKEAERLAKQKEREWIIRKAEDELYPTNTFSVSSRIKGFIDWLKEGK